MTRHLSFRLAPVVALLAVAALASAQSGSGQAARSGLGSEPAGIQPPAPGRPVQGPALKPTGEGEAPAVYSYHAEGRRDPFVALWSPGTGPNVRAKAEGLAGLYTVDLTIKGILQSRGRFVAIVLGPDGKRQYIVHPNDRLADGVVKAITADSMLILQEVSDPLSLAKQREIRKTLRAVEEVK
jgi:Tfp pilus assembly protein PilP